VNQLVRVNGINQDKKKKRGLYMFKKYKKNKKGAAAIEYTLHFLFSIIIPLIVFLVLYQAVIRVGSDDSFHMPALTKDVANTLETVASLEGDVWILYRYNYSISINYSDNDKKIYVKRERGPTFSREVFIPKYLQVQTQKNNVQTSSQLQTIQSQSTENSQSEIFTKSYIIAKKDDTLIFAPIVDTTLGNVLLNCSEKPKFVTNILMQRDVLETPDQNVGELQQNNLQTPKIFNITTKNPEYAPLIRDGKISLDISVLKSSQKGVVILIDDKFERTDIKCQIERAFMSQRIDMPIILFLPRTQTNEIRDAQIEFVLASDLSLLPSQLQAIIRRIELSQENLEVLTP
jgi:hypothetical protein